MIVWQPVGPGTWQPEHEPTIDDLIAEQRDELAIAAAPAKVRTCADPDPDEQVMSAGITYQQCGGGRRIIKKKIGGA